MTTTDTKPGKVPETEAADLEAPAQKTTACVPAGQLRKMLTAVLPHAGGDDTLPALMAVQLEVRNSWLYLVATDRYTLAAARLAAADAGPDADALLPLGAAMELRRILKGTQEVAALTLSAGHVSVKVTGGMSCQWAAHGAGAWTDLGWRRLPHAALENPPAEMGDAYAVDAAYLARFLTGGKNWQRPLSIRVTGKPDSAPMVVVTREDWLIGAAMTMRIGSPAGAWKLWADACTPPSLPRRCQPMPDATLPGEVELDLGLPPEPAAEKCRAIKHGRVDLHCTLPRGHDKPQGDVPGTWHEALFSDHQEITYDGARHVVDLAEHVTWEPVDLGREITRLLTEGRRDS